MRSDAHPFDRRVVWYVVFHQKGRYDFWARRFHHVSLAGYSNETWINLDLHREGVHVIPIYHYEEVGDYLDWLTANHTVLKFGEASGLSTFGRPMTCVAFVKHCLGVRSSALRPDGLFRTLTRNYGCEVMNEIRFGTETDAGPERAEQAG